MGRKNKLLFIGELSKLTGASLRSLRYYETINLLKPAYVDPDSGYRYYSFDHTRLVELIMFCIELDIPLKELTSFTDADDTIDFRAFLAHGKKIAEQKLQNINQGLRLIQVLEEKIDLAAQFQPGQIYEQTFPQKYIHAKAYDISLKERDLPDIFASLADIPYTEYGYSDLPEYGFLCEHSAEQSRYYAFTEVPKHMANKTIPAGAYLCRQEEQPQIERVDALFATHLAKDAPYLAIETEIFSGKHKISQPLHEVRVIVR